ncbi:MAG: hypothetical protein AB1758_36540, partial [Candidatus Eremiobacterota bacterium]
MVTPPAVMHYVWRAPASVSAERPWSNSGHSLKGARNAHTTNTREQLEAAFREETHWLEGDVRASLD